MPGYEVMRVELKKLQEENEQLKRELEIQERLVKKLEERFDKALRNALANLADES